MRKILFVVMLMLMVSTTVYGQATNWNIFGRPNADWFSGNNTPRDIAHMWMKAVDPMIASIGGGGKGANLYIDSNVASAGDGSSWANAVVTWDEAVDLADPNTTLHFAEGHTETFSTDAALDNDSVDIDVAGLKCIAYGTGSDRALFIYADPDNEVVIGAPNVSLYNMQFMASVDSVVHLVEIEADADGYGIYNCEFLEPESADTTDEADDIIQVAAAANKGYIVGNTFYSLSAGANTAVDLTAGVIEDTTIAYNYFNGVWAEGAIFSDDIDLRARIIGNRVIQGDAAMTPITFDTTATGIMEDNWCTSKSTTYLIDAGAMQCKGNMWSDTDTADVAAIPMFTSETGVDIWAASQTTQIQSAATAAIEADFLHLLISATVADEIIDASILADITTTASDWSDFVASTDSLQAISDKITALTGYIHTGTNSAATSTTPVVAALIGYGEDYFNTDWVMIVLLNADSHGSAPEGDVRDISNYVTADGTFTIDATSAALATGDIVMVARKEAFILAGIASGSGVYPTGVADDSILAILLSKSGTAAASSYSNTTDSMEMLSDKLGAFAGTSGAAANESVKAALVLVQTDLDTISADTEALDSQAEMLKLTRTADVNTTSITASPTASTLSDTLHKDGSFTFDNTTDALEAIADQVEYSMTVTRTKDGGIDLVSGTNNLFVVTGPIEVTVLTAIVVQQLKTVANDCKFIHTTTVPASGVDITSALECSGDVAGTSYSINTTLGGVLIATTAGTVATSTCVEFLAPAGTIGFNAAGTFDAGDSIVFYIKYKPLAADSRVTASP